MIKRYRQDSVNGMVEDCDYGPYVLRDDHVVIVARKDETIRTLQERLSQAHADHTAACSRAEGVAKQLDAERSDRTAIQARLNHELDENIGFRGTIIQLERHIKRLANERDEANRTISRERGEAVDKVRAQSAEIERLLGERDTWERDARDACSTLAPVMAERDRLREELAALKAATAKPRPIDPNGYTIRLGSNMEAHAQPSAVGTPGEVWVTIRQRGV